MARRLEVLLRETIKNLGRVGDVVSVAPGYANNFLLPSKLAVHATAENKRQMARRAVRMRTAEENRDAEVNAKVATLGELVVTATEKADEKGNLYGSVSATQIAALVTAAGTPVEDKQVRLEAPLKHTGEHAVRVHIFGDHEATITVKVEAAAE
ncbi:MAG: large subunit ribosomal protein L9 [Planctomycetota bacterium]|jgi:large subunit ribosomal protein L9